MIIDPRFTKTPFVNKGRSFKGADCYGILKLYYKVHLGIEIPEIIIHPDDTKKIMDTYLEEISKNWIQIDKPEAHCAVAMNTSEKYPKRITHFGVMIDNKRILHTFRKWGCNVIRIDNPIISTQIKGFYRWQN